MAPVDTFIDDEDDTCPLCIEEFDLSDRNFRPCPCGYKVCQFCFNNIKSNMNGLCPACRRPYDEKTIEWKVVTPEEEAEFRANIAKNQKKRAQEQRQKETQKREQEKESRKNLVGVRVVQKNLVYVTGLTPTIREDELAKTLRKPEFFGQYGNIQKISISNRKSNDGQNPSLGIYVTFEKPEEADRCIRAVHGSQNGERILRAQLGTTKYCSAWLKHEVCTNRGCMFLHERGDEEDSYTRQDLSSMNSIHTQRPISSTSAGSSRSAARQQPAMTTASQTTQQAQPQPPPQASSSSQAAIARPASREGSENGGDNSALPSSANWARNPRSRRGSQATSGAAPSPAVSAALPVTAEVVQEDEEPEPTAENRSSITSMPETTVEDDPELDQFLQARPSAREMASMIARWRMPRQTAAEKEFARNGPAMFDPHGGEKRRRMREVEEARLRGHQEEQAVSQEPSEEGEPESSGSLALGGEPEDRQPTREPHRPDPRSAVFGNVQAAQPGYAIGTRTITPQQQQMYMRPSSTFTDHLPPGITQNQSPFQQQGHSRQTSRYSFASGDASGSTSVNLAANPRIMAQQKSMMPSPYPSSMSAGPPPGLKSTGTPPSMFGQGGGASSFGSGSPFSAGPKDSGSDAFQSLARARAAAAGGGGGNALDGGKREFPISPFSNQYPPVSSTSSSSTPAPALGFMASLYGSQQPGQLQDFGPKQKKKGKKHRHANTSSSGGSGLVDLADPSILRAGMGHQSQSNAGVGQQGLHGGQTHGGYNPQNVMYNSNGYPRW